MSTTSTPQMAPQGDSDLHMPPPEESSFAPPTLEKEASCASMIQANVRGKQTRAKLRWQKVGSHIRTLVQVWHRLQSAQCLSSSSEAIKKEVERNRAKAEMQVSSVVLIAANASNQEAKASKGHSWYLDKLRKGFRLSYELEKANRVRRAVELLRMGTDAMQRALNEGNVIMTHSAGETVHITKQGDESMYSSLKLAQRMALRNDPEVLEWLRKWWLAAQRSFQRTTGDQVDIASDPPLTLEGYKMMYKCVFRVLMDDYNEADADAAITADWSNDSRGNNVMTRDHFMDSLVRAPLRQPSFHAPAFSQRPPFWLAIPVRTVRHLDKYCHPQRVC